MTSSSSPSLQEGLDTMLFFYGVLQRHTAAPACEHFLLASSGWFPSPLVPRRIKLCRFRRTDFQSVRLSADGLQIRPTTLDQVIVARGLSSPLKYSPPGAFSLATFALDDSAWLWPNARRDRNRFSSLPNNSRHRPAIRSTRSSINSLMRIALTHRYRRTPHANIVTTRVR